MIKETMKEKKVLKPSGREEGFSNQFARQCQNGGNAAKGSRNRVDEE